MTLDDPLTQHFRLNPLQLKVLEKLKIATTRDLLFYLPFRYGHQVAEKTIAELMVGEEAAVYGQVINAKISQAWKKKIPLGEITIEDATGRIKAVWFHQAFLAKKVASGQNARLQGKVAERRGQKYLVNPEIEAASTGALDHQTLFNNAAGSSETNFLIPVYPETRGLSSSWFHHHIKKILATGLTEQLIDPLPTTVLEKYHLPTLGAALVWIHSPKKEADALAARKRFAFQEILLIQLARLRAKRAYRAQPTYRFATDPVKLTEFIGRFPFALTNAQQAAIKQILADGDRNEPMTRLLEGDVGSGKTAVAVTAAYAAVTAGLEVAYMAPTEILARQHFESFINYFNATGGTSVPIGLITGNGCYKFPSKVNPHGPTSISRPQLLKWVANGEIPILVGTHALIQKAVRFKKLGLVIIDEQHRFGVMQRAKLAKKGSGGKDEARGPAPHLLSMTATPIPRTLALTIYGDLDLTLLDEMPAGRKQIVTKIVREDERSAAYEHGKKELQAGRQAYIICPRIDEPDPLKELALQAKSAKAEQKYLQEKVFPEFTVGLVHSKLLPKAKEKIMADFAGRRIDILVATSVVEVGVNVPNATVIMIEGAERFGLAQLHQLRGRVWRSNHQSYCYLCTTTTSQKSLERLKALQTAKNGFELAELDLALRGAGSLGAGGKQWGLSDLGMEAIKNLKMVEAARAEATTLLDQDPALKNHQRLREALAERKVEETHWE